MPSARPSLLRRALSWSQLAGVASVGVALLSTGCFYNDTGLLPPTNSFYFPTGLVVSPGRSVLYVANSDFDLQYNGGTVQIVDLATLRASLGPMLAGIRCSEGVASACAAGTTTSTTLSDVCHAVPVVPGVGKQGTACTQPGDCASNLCLNNGCWPCSTAADCPGGATGSIAAEAENLCPGLCTAGVCGVACNQNQILTPAACTPLSPVIKSVASIGAFASGAVLALDPTPGHARLFIPVRGDPSITWFDVDDDRVASVAQSPLDTLDCGQSATDNRCADEHRMGVDPYDNFRDSTLPVEPVGLDVSSDGRNIVTAHQISGAPAIGLSVNAWDGSRPTFQFALTGNVAAGPTEVVHIPPPALVAAANVPGAPPVVNYEQGFAVTYNLTPEVDTFRVDPDADSSPPRPFLTRASQAGVSVNANGNDSRGIVIDDSARAACEAACGPAPSGTAPPAYLACLRTCVATPLPTFIANRAPPSLLFGQLQSTVVDSDTGDGSGSGIFDTIQIFNQTAIPQGASKVYLGPVIQPDGSVRNLVFVVSFDTNFVSIYDPHAQMLLSPIGTGRGPFAIAFDACTTNCAVGEAPHAYLYVGHFTDSYLGVVDLDMRHPETFGSMFASVGFPIAPLESK
jgi:hypothetical protein